MRFVRAVAFAALLVQTIAPTAFSEPDSWTGPKRTPGTDGVWNKVYWYAGGVPETPSTGVVFDPKRTQLVWFTQDWIRLEPIKQTPESHTVIIRGWPGIPVAYSAIYDPRRDRVVVLTLDSLLYNVGTFALPLRDPNHWERLVPFGASPNLSYASAVYDPTGDRMIVYGGVDFSKGYEAQGEVWSLPLGEHTQWARIEPRGRVPPPRMDHTAVYDAEHGAMVVYGGRTALNGVVLGDAWSLEFEPQPHWRPLKIHGVTPASRTGQTAVYDSRRGRMIVMGGRSAPPLRWEFDYDDIWALSLGGAPQWLRLNPGGERPPAFLRRFAFADAASDRMILTSYAGSLLWTLDWGGDVRASIPDADLLKPLTLGSPRQSSPPELSLRIPCSLCSGGTLTALVSLPEASKATLGMFDAGGRRVWAAGPNALGVGTHEVAIAPAMRLPAGVYFLRLEQRGQSTAAKVVRVP